MFSINSTSSKFTAKIQADRIDSTSCDAYELSRTMVRFERNDSQVTSIYNIAFSWTGGYSGYVSYYSDPDGVLEIPLRNIISAHVEDTVTMGVQLFEINFTSVDTLGVQLLTHKGISYNDALSPLNKDININDFPNALSHAVVLPPNVMLNPNFGHWVGAGLCVESNYADMDGDAQWSGITGGIGTSITPAGERDNLLRVIAAYDTLQLATGKNHDKIKRWKLEKPDQCTDLVCVQWTSLTGCLRRHFFYVVSFINSIDKEVSIIEAGNGYDVRKNAFKGVRCRLTGLTSYSCWYYQDLLQASDAHAVVHRSWSSLYDELTSMETACYVEGGFEATPEGNGFYSFEFTLKLRHYDTV